MHKKNAETRTC